MNIRFPQNAGSLLAYWRNISYYQIRECYIELLDALVVGKEVKLSLRVTMYHDGNVYVGNGVALHNLSMWAMV